MKSRFRAAAAAAAPRPGSSAHSGDKVQLAHRTVPPILVWRHRFSSFFYWRTPHQAPAPDGPPEPGPGPAGQARRRARAAATGRLVVLVVPLPGIIAASGIDSHSASHEPPPTRPGPRASRQRPSRRSRNPRPPAAVTVSHPALMTAILQVLPVPTGQKPVYRE